MNFFAAKNVGFLRNTIYSPKCRTHSSAEGKGNQFKNFCDRAFCAAGPQVWNYLLTDLRQAGLVIQPFQTVAEDSRISSMGPTRSENPPAFNCTLEILLLT